MLNNENSQVRVTRSLGRARGGIQYYYIRPALKCLNRSRRVRSDRVQWTIDKHYPVVNYYRIDGVVIGAKDEDSARKEYKKVCEMRKQREYFEAELIPGYDVPR